MLVFRNRWDKGWMCSVGNRPIHDKTRNDYQRKKQGLPKGCCFSKLRVDAMLCGFEPAKLMKKAEYCYKHGVDEVSSR